MTIQQRVIAGSVVWSHPLDQLGYMYATYPSNLTTIEVGIYENHLEQQAAAKKVRDAETAAAIDVEGMSAERDKNNRDVTVWRTGDRESSCVYFKVADCFFCEAEKLCMAASCGYGDSINVCQDCLGLMFGALDQSGDA